mmetsp:Transcript_23113/g.29602  ORF Transcript_23113/g.29602 Transcript_23113/m.29602 type:complete len:120 (-) Transcript_23113:200-559(-)|eukprot:CAMPEP_0183719872 /NCGR_PEP_ID=MMETSP0737-20130205/12644_1 /TAXON_ID=385413 /ORGANISM="Thalassiosira miniscula, Strain CCMP1093" /LENGTH=119 /DNA_ID=CAMNT_0025949635 /DNA_START=111 /DNA_END=470 /DNA_ORIENTATION=-
MKWRLSLLPILPSASLAFQHASPPIIVRHASRLNYFPEKFSRAEQCATHYGSCNLDELEELANELEQFQSSDDGELQGRDDYTDTKRVVAMLRAQSTLEHEMDDYVNDHHTETFDMSDV